jgi:hypothetical protein
MLKQTSKYFIVGNQTFTEDELRALPNQVVKDINVVLPEWFVSVRTEKKFTKFYGATITSLLYTTDETGKETIMIENPLHVTLHCDLARHSTNGYVDKKYIQINPNHTPSPVNCNEDYLGTINNYQYQKIYEILPNTHEINFYFTSPYGKKVSIIEVNNTDSFNCLQTLYKIELELIIQTTK